MNITPCLSTRLQAIMLQGAEPHAKAASLQGTQRQTCRYFLIPRLAAARRPQCMHAGCAAVLKQASGQAS